MNPDRIARLITEDIRPGTTGIRIISEGNEQVVKAIAEYFSEGDEIQIDDLDYKFSGRYYPATRESPEEYPELEVNDFTIKPIKSINLTYLKDYFNADEKTVFDIIQQNLPLAIPFTIGYSVGDNEVDIKLTGKFYIKSIQPPQEVPSQFKSSVPQSNELVSVIETTLDKKDWGWE